MNLKGYGRKRTWTDVKYYPGISLEGLIKQQNSSVRIASFHASIGTQNLQNTK
jgi:hypothetical protein